MKRNPLLNAIVALAVVLVTSLVVRARPVPGIPLPRGTSPDVSEAVEQLFELDDTRLASRGVELAEQDLTRCEIDVCIDPGRGWISGSCRLRFDVAQRAVELSLDEALTVLSLTDAAGRARRFERAGRIITIPSREVGGPLELNITYEGLVRPASGAALTEQGLIILLGGDCWYPCSRDGDRAFIRAVVRHPGAYASVFSGALAGMAPPPATRPGPCVCGDVWEADSSGRASVVVGRIESSLSILGGLFAGTHRFTGSESTHGAEAVKDSSPSAQRSLDLGMKEPLRFLESCFGPYPLDWLNILTVPYGTLGVPAVSGPGLLIVESTPGDAACLHPPDPDLYLLELARTWWLHAYGAGPLFADGLAAHMEIQWLDSVRGEEDAARRRAFRREQYMRAVTDSGGAAPLSLCLGRNASSDTRISLGRGSALMGIVSALLGHDAFCGLVAGLAADAGTSPPSLRTFAAALTAAAGSDMDWLLYEWVFRGDLPVYSLDYKAKSVRGGGYMVSGALRQLVEPFRTPLPLTVDLGGWTYDEWVTVESAEQSFEFRTELEPLSVTIDAGNIVHHIETGDQARVHSELGRRAAAGNLWAEAVNQFGAAVALDPKRALYHAQYGEALVRVGRPAEGLKALAEAIDRSPSNADYIFTTGRLSGQTGDYRAAVELLERYVRLRPDEPRGHVELAAALVGLGKLPEALAHLDRCPLLLDDTPDDTWLERYHIAVGMYREARGESGLAISAYEAALAVNPVSDEARRRLTRLRAR